MRKRIVVSFNFPVMHKWEMAPDAYVYLSNLHRHLFYVRAEKIVSHNEREIEFIQFKQELLNAAILKTENAETLRWSCESWCEWFLNRFDLFLVSVLEDNENGAILSKEE